MTSKSPNAREQTESEDDFSLPSTLTKKTNYFEINYDPADILDSDSDQNLEADEISDMNQKDESSQYSLFRKPIEQLVNENPQSMIQMEAQMQMSMMNHQSKVKIADIGRNRTQENQGLQTNLLNDFVSYEQNDPTQHTTEGQIQENTYNSPLIRLNMNNNKNSLNQQQQQVNNTKQIDQRQALLKFKSHEASSNPYQQQFEDSQQSTDATTVFGKLQNSNQSNESMISRQIDQYTNNQTNNDTGNYNYGPAQFGKQNEFLNVYDQHTYGQQYYAQPEQQQFQHQQQTQFFGSQRSLNSQSPIKQQFLDPQFQLNRTQISTMNQSSPTLAQDFNQGYYKQNQQLSSNFIPGQGTYQNFQNQQTAISSNQNLQQKKDPQFFLATGPNNQMHIQRSSPQYQYTQSEQQLLSQQLSTEMTQINLGHQDSSTSQLSNLTGYKTPVFQSANSQFEEQQKQLISGFEGIELNNQQAHKSQQNLQLSQQQQQQQQQQVQQVTFNQEQQQKFLSEVNQRQFSQTSVTTIPTTNPPPGLENVIPNPRNNIQSQESIKQSNSPQLNHSPNPPIQYAPQLVNPILGTQLGSSTNANQGIVYPPMISNNVLIDQNESILVKIMCNYEEATNQSQKLNSLKGNVIKLSINQTGSKFLQRLLDNANPQIVQFLLDEIQSHLPMVMIDNYGNYFCQQLLINCSSSQRMQILERIAVDFVAICCNKKGTHTIQKFIDLVNLEAEEKFFQRVLAGHVAFLSFDVQGTHVIQNIIKCFEEQKRQFVFDEIYDKFVELATNNSGLCVVKIIISKTFKQENRQKLMKKLVLNSIELAQNPYGNYAIQQAFENWDKELCQEMIPQFIGKVYQLSMQKCSSNVIDKCIQNAKPEYLQKIMQELINCERLNNLIMNSYGNFVVQNALKYATLEDRTKLSEQIEKNIPNITDGRIKQKWIALLKKKNLGDLKGQFISGDSEGSESSQRGNNRRPPNNANEFPNNKGGKRVPGPQIQGQQMSTMPPQTRQAPPYFNPAMMPPPNQAQSHYMMPSYYNAPVYQQQQYMMNKQPQNQMMGGYLVNPQGYMMQQQYHPQMMGYQPSISIQNQQQIVPPQAQYDPLGLNEQGFPKRQQMTSPHHSHQQQHIQFSQTMQQQTSQVQLNQQQQFMQQQQQQQQQQQHQNPQDYRRYQQQ